MDSCFDFDSGSKLLLYCLFFPVANLCHYHILSKKKTTIPNNKQTGSITPNQNSSKLKWNENMKFPQYDNNSGDREKAQFTTNASIFDFPLYFWTGVDVFSTGQLMKCILFYFFDILAYPKPTVLESYLRWIHPKIFEILICEMLIHPFVIASISSYFKFQSGISILLQTSTIKLFTSGLLCRGLLYVWEIVLWRSILLQMILLQAKTLQERSVMLFIHFAAMKYLVFPLYAAFVQCAVRQENGLMEQLKAIREEFVNWNWTATLCFVLYASLIELTTPLTYLHGTNEKRL